MIVVNGIIVLVVVPALLIALGVAWLLAGLWVARKVLGFGS